jgi:hypothetical protein
MTVHNSSLDENAVGVPRTNGITNSMGITNVDWTSHHLCMKVTESFVFLIQYPVIV